MAGNNSNGAFGGGSGGIRRDSVEELEILRQIEALNKKINNQFTNYFQNWRDINEQQKQHNDRAAEIESLRNQTQTEEIKELIRIYDLEGKILDRKRLQLKSTSLLKMTYNSIEKSSSAFFSGALMKGVNYILDADRAFKSVNLQLGLAGNNSNIFLSNLIKASRGAAVLGATFEDLSKIQGGYSDEIGRAVLLNDNNLKSIVAIGKGTGIGIEMAAKMTGQFSNMGKSIESTKEFYEDAINSASKYGVSANKVINKINENLDKSQGYVFKGGVNGLRKMSEFSTKFKIEMTDVFNAMDKARGLEGAVNMAAQLQVIGGKFANQDPFKLLFQARNDAEGFTKTMQGLTKGMAVYNKTTGEFEIQAGDLDRLRLAAQATGMSFEDMVKQAKRGSEISKITDQLGGIGLSKESREFIEGIAQIQKDGSFKVQIAPGEFRDIRSLSENQVKAVMSSNKTLEDRAKDAQAFDEVFKNTINELKTALLPFLTTVNKFTRMITENREVFSGVVGLGIGLMGLSAIAKPIKSSIEIFKAIKGNSIFGKGAAAVATSATPNLPNPQNNGGALAGNIQQQGQAAGGAAKNMLAFGAAVVMVGGGIWLATKGIAAMATSFKGLDATQIKGIAITLGILMAGMVGIVALSPLLGASAIPLLAFGGAILAIGAGIGLASAGVGYMAKGLGEMFDSVAKISNPNILKNLNGLVLSIAALGASSILFSNPLAWVGLKMLGSTISDISTRLKEASFQNLNVAANNFNRISQAINSINDEKLDKLLALSNASSSIGSGLNSFINSLSKLFDRDIEVKFAEGEVNLQLNITNEIDSQPLLSKLSKQIPLHIERVKKGGQS